MKAIKLYGTTNASGALTINGSDTFSAGKLYAVQWIDGTFDNGVDAVISTQGNDASKTLLTLTDANDDALYYPRDLVHDAAGTALTGTSGGDRALPLVSGKLRLVVSSGGDTKEGGCVVFLE